MSTNEQNINYFKAFDDSDNLELLINNYLNLINDYKNIIYQFMDYKKNSSSLKNDKNIKLLNTIIETSSAAINDGNINELIAENKQLKDQVSSLKQAYSDILKSYDELKVDSIDNYNKLHQDYLNLSKNLSASIDQEVPNTPVKQSNEDLYELKETNQKLSLKLQLAQDEIKSKSELNIMACNEIERIKCDEFENRIKLESLNKQLENETLAKESLKRQLNDFEQKLKIVEDKNKSLIDKLNQKDREIDSLKSKTFRFELQNQEFQETNRKLQENIEYLQKEIDETTKESCFSGDSALDLTLPGHFQKSRITNMNKSRTISTFKDINRHENPVDDRRLRVYSSEDVQYFLKSLSDQMYEVQNQVYEHTQDSSTWKYRLGFACEKCEMEWEIEHHVVNIHEANNIPEDFFDMSIIRPLPKCDCYLH